MSTFENARGSYPAAAGQGMAALMYLSGQRRAAAIFAGDTPETHRQ